jgi:flagellar M-ring protein FliF
MKDFFNKYLEQLKTFWDSLETKKKIIFSSVAGGVFLFLIIIIITFSGQKQGVSLFEHPLNLEESGAISKQLDSWNINYTFDNNVIRVLPREKNSILLRLAGDNKLPKTSAPGFKLFDDIKFGATEYEKHIQYARAVEGHLQNMIVSLSPIKSATVGIHLPKQRLFLDDQVQPTASIRVEIEPFENISKDQIIGIINLATYYIPNLTKENVAVIDSRGVTLSDITMEDDLVSTEIGRQQKLKRDLQNNLQSQIMRTIGDAYGSDKVRASVFVDMNFDRIEERHENYSQTGFEPIKSSAERIEEEFEGIGLKPGGAPGVDANVPVYKGIQEHPIKYRKEENRDNFQPNVSLVTKNKNPAVTRITASVQIDGSYTESLDDDGLPTWTYEPRDLEELDKIRNLVATSIGINFERGDVLTVENIPFDRTAEFKQIREQILIAKKREEIMKYGILAAIIFVLLAIVSIELNKRWVLVREELNKKRALAAKEAMASGVMYDVEMSASDKEKLELVKHAQQAARDDPEMVANLLKTWLLDED